MEAPTIQKCWDQIFKLFGNSDFNVFVYGGFSVSIIAFWLIGGAFLIVDITGKPKFMWKYKIQDSPKPEYPLVQAQVTDLLTVIFFNQVLFILLYVFAFYVRDYYGIKINHIVPDIWTAAFHFIFFAIVVEIGFYYSHRLMHHPKLYKLIHKKHHTWISPVAISAIYCHPIEQIFSNILPVIGGPLLLNSHLLLQWLWVVLSLGSTLVVHSGFHLPFLTSPEFHDFHHLKFNYNYGVLGILDYLHGTDVLFRKSKQFKRHKSVWTLTPIKTLIP